MVALLVAAATAAPAAAKLPTIAGVRVGFDGHYKVGHWVPVAVTIAGVERPHTCHVDLILPDGDGLLTRFTGPVDDAGRLRPLIVPAGGETTAIVYGRFGRTDAELTVRLVASDDAASKGDDADDAPSAADAPTPGSTPPDRHAFAETTFTSRGGRHSIPAPLAATDVLYVVVGDPLGVSEATRRPADAVGPQVKVARIDDVAALPARWQGYDGVDGLLVGTSRADLLAALSDAPQAAAIATWVRLGGRLVLSVGSRAAEALAADSPLAPLAPGRFARMVPLRRPSVFEQYADSSEPLADPARPFRMEVPLLEEVRGAIDAYEGTRARDLPLVIRSPHGFGRVVLLAADLDRPPLATWKGRTQLVQQLLGIEAERFRDDDRGGFGQVNSLGYNDLAGQLRAALDRFSGVRVIPFWAVATLALLYVAWIGPIDYWIVRRLFRRSSVTWITFPLAVVAVSAAAWLLAVRAKGEALQLNQVELVDVDVESGLVRGTLWANLFTPRAAAHDVGLQAVAPAGSEIEAPPDVLLSWMGLPGGALGGMSGGGANPPQFRRPYDFAPADDRLLGVPLPMWSSKGFTARWHGTARPPLTAQLRAQTDELLAGEITSGLETELLDVRLLYDRWAWRIPRLAAGELLVIDDRRPPQTSKTLFTRQRILDHRDVSTKYDETSTDVARIMEMIMFHTAAGGSRYTKGLTSSYHRDSDLSGHLRAGRAVLVGRAATGGSRLVVDGKPQPPSDDGEWTFYRFVISVEPRS